MFEKLSNIVMVSSQNQFSNKVNLKRVKTDLEEIKRRIDYLEGIKGLDGAMKNTHISNGENLQQTNGNGKGKERELDYRGASSDINSKSLDQALQDLSIDGVKSNTSPKLSRAAQMELKREENSVSESKMRGKVGRIKQKTLRWVEADLQSRLREDGEKHLQYQIRVVYET